MRLPGLIAVSLVAGACAGDAGDHVAQGAPPTGRAALALLGGSPSPTLVSLSPSERRAIGAFTRDGVVRCTGTLVAPRRVLTAAHCFADETTLGPFDFVIEGDDGATVMLPPQRVDAHGAVDLALVTLGADVPAVPITLDLGANAGEPVPSAVEAAGAGLGSAGAVRFQRFDVTEVEGPALLLESEAGDGLCGGDSGGPILRVRADGAAEVIAVASTSGPNCTAPARAVMTSIAREWLEQTLSGPLPPESGSCDDLRDPGRCVGAIGESCRAGWWRGQDCAAAGLYCGALPGGGDGCLPPPCGAVDRHGLCDDGVAYWCDVRGLEAVDCQARGLACGFDAAATLGGGFRCLDCPACDGECVDVRTWRDHCGECGVACDGECVDGLCVDLAPKDPAETTEPSGKSPARAVMGRSSGAGGCAAGAPQTSPHRAMALLLVLVGSCMGSRRRFWRSRA